MGYTNSEGQQKGDKPLIFHLIAWQTSATLLPDIQVAVSRREDAPFPVLSLRLRHCIRYQCMIPTPGLNQLIDSESPLESLRRVNQTDMIASVESLGARQTTVFRSLTHK